MVEPAPVPPRFLESDMTERLRLLADSFCRLLGRALVDLEEDSPTDLVSALWNAETPIVAHGTEADPVFFFANRAALAAFETTVEQFTAMPSRYSAEAPDRAERQALLTASAGMATPAIIAECGLPPRGESSSSPMGSSGT